MKKYWIKGLDEQFWCRTRMKPTNMPDIPSSYRIQGYWSRFDDEYSIRNRVKYLWIFAQLERLIMKLLSNISTNKVKVEGEKHG